MNFERIYGERARLHAALGEPHRLAILEALALSDRSPSELAAGLGMTTNLLAHHLEVLERAGLVSRGTSEGDRRRRYLRLERSALGGMVRPSAIETRSVLFVCSRNSARSQLAAALWGRSSSVPALSAGSEPADAVHPRAVEVAREAGLDLFGSRPRSYLELEEPPGLVVAVCDRAYEGLTWEEIPVLHWSVPDPVRRGTRSAFRRAFHSISERIDDLAPIVVPAA